MKPRYLTESEKAELEEQTRRGHQEAREKLAQMRADGRLPKLDRIRERVQAKTKGARQVLTLEGARD